MSPDAIAERALIELSRLQRETLERWALIAAAAGEHDFADEAVAELCHRDARAEEEEFRRAA